MIFIFYSRFIIFNTFTIKHSARLGGKGRVIGLVFSG